MGPVFRTFAALLLILAGASPAAALKFDPVNQKDLPPNVRSALWVRDCEPLTEHCEEHELQFTEGDAVRLSRVLSQRSYDEIWLDSGGGNLAEGIAVGEVLRRVQAVVRVPPGAACASSCTVAFLGGVFRYIDLAKGASYHVHAASMFTKADNKWIREVAKSDEETLGAVAESLVANERDLAAELFVHFQKAVHPLGELPGSKATEVRRRLDRWLKAADPDLYAERDRRRADVERIKREGVVASQEILMRLERDAMQLAINDLRKLLPELGPRADPALRMLEAMYSSRITGTASLSYETLLQMGYITQVFNPIKL